LTENVRRYPPVVTYVTTEKDWSRGLDAAETPEQLVAYVGSWAPFVPDAAAIAMGLMVLAPPQRQRAWMAWRTGLARERERKPNGKPWMKRWGPLLIPEKLLDASLLARAAHVPLGTALIRMSEVQK